MQFKFWFQSEVEFGSTRRTDPVLDWMAFPHSPTLPPRTNHAVLGLSAYFDIERVRVSRSHRVIRRQWCHVAAFQPHKDVRIPCLFPLVPGRCVRVRTRMAECRNLTKLPKLLFPFIYLTYLYWRDVEHHVERERERKEICLLHKVECVRARQYSNTVSRTTYTTYPLLNSPTH